MCHFAESVVEYAPLAWLDILGYAVLHGPHIVASMLAAERTDPNYREVALDRRLRQALFLLNPDLPQEALDDAYRKLIRSDAPFIARGAQPRQAWDVSKLGHGRISPQGQFDRQTLVNGSIILVLVKNYRDYGAMSA